MTKKRKTPDSPRQQASILVSALAAVLLLAPLVGCRLTGATPATRNVINTTLAGYHIQVSLDRSTSFESRDDHALITFGHHRLRIEKGRVVLDDNETAAFPITATQIAIEVSKGTLRMTADGKEMWKRRLPAE